MICASIKERTTKVRRPTASDVNSRGRKRMMRTNRGSCFFCTGDFGMAFDRFDGTWSIARKALRHESPACHSGLAPEAASPESIRRTRDYGFRARGHHKSAAADL